MARQLSIKSLILYNIYYKIRDLLSNDYSNVTVTPQFPMRPEELSLPEVTIFSGPSNTSPSQLGGGRFIFETYSIDVWSKSPEQRDDLLEYLFSNLIDQGYKIINYNNNNWPYLPPTSNNINGSYDSNITSGIFYIEDGKYGQIDPVDLSDLGIYRGNLTLTIRYILE